MKPYKIIASGSTGNCEIYLNTIAIDMGISYKQIEPYKNDLQIVLLSHIHGDHFNIATIKKLAFERPSLRFACGNWLAEYLTEIKNVDILELNKWYNYGNFKISIGQLYHDVQNAFFRIDTGSYKIFRATDTAHLEGISAPNYDLYAIEHNYSEETVHDQIAAIESRGEFAYQKGAVNSHLSYEQAQEFFFNNKGPNSEVIRLHESSSNK